MFALNLKSIKNKSIKLIPGLQAVLSRKAGRAPGGPYKRLLKEASPYWPLLALGFVATLTSGGVDAGLAFLIKPIIDKGFIDKDVAYIHWFPLCILLLFTIRAVAGFIANYFITRVGQNVVMDFRQAIFKHLLYLPAEFFDKNSSGKLLSIFLYNVSNVSRAATNAVLVLLREGATVIASVVVMFVLAWKLSFIFLFSMPFILAMVRYVSKRSRRISAETQDALGEVSHIVEESIEGYRVIRTFSGEAFEINKFNAATKQNRQLNLKVAVTDSLGTATVQMLIAIPFAFAVFLATRTQITAGSIIAVIVCMFRISAPVRRLTRINSKIQEGIAGAQSVFELLDEPLERDEGRTPLTKSQGHVEFKQVNFAYPGAKDNALKDVSFTVKPGETVALVGHSGGGKSSLVKLLPRFYEIQSGEILIDGVNINAYRLCDLRRQFSFVSQQVVLFNDTIANNIAYAAQSQVTEVEIRQAAEAAYAIEFIERLPHGFDTHVGEDGLLLSGGQRQRLALARAILKNSPILLLDEATSALDSVSEQHIQAALPALLSTRTTFIVAHRLSTIEHADHILVLEGGRVVEQGTHEQLLAQEGAYATLYRTQLSSVLAETTQ